MNNKINKLPNGDFEVERDNPTVSAIKQSRGVTQTTLEICRTYCGGEIKQRILNGDCDNCTNHSHHYSRLNLIKRLMK